MAISLTWHRMSACFPLLLALGTGLLAPLYAGAQTVEEVVRLKTRGDVEQAYWLVHQAGLVRVVAVVFTGGYGLLNLRATEAGIVWDQEGSSFLVLNKDLFVDGETAVALIDVPSDQRNFGYIPRFRKSAAHAADVAAVVGDLRCRFAQARIVLIGTSQGTTSAAYAGKALGKNIDGVVLTASVLEWALGSWRYLNDSNLKDFDFSTIAAPMLIVHHVDDRCVATPYAAAEKLAGQFPFIAVRGGDPVQDNGCGPRGPHGFLGREAPVATEIKNWMHGRPYRAEIP